MIHSLIDTTIGKDEFQLLVDQDHLEKVWTTIKTNLDQYIDGYLEYIASYQDIRNRQGNYAIFLAELIKKNDELKDKYTRLFSIDLMETEYSEDTQGFKDVVLKKDCDVIRNTLQSKSESLREWKAKFFGCKSQHLYDTFYNMMDFAFEYDTNMDENEMASLDSIEDCGLGLMNEYNCYQVGVIGFGIVSNILNHMYPRTFPGNYKAGVYSLHFLSGEGNGIDMPSETSEFCMIKDDVYSKTGTIETEHNFYFPYETFAIYTLRIYRVLVDRLQMYFQREFPANYRFLLTNSFYEYVVSRHKADISTMNGNDDILKFNTAL